LKLIPHPSVNTLLVVNEQDDGDDTCFESFLSLCSQWNSQQGAGQTIDNCFFGSSRTALYKPPNASRDPNDDEEDTWESQLPHTRQFWLQESDTSAESLPIPESGWDMVLNHRNLSIRPTHVFHYTRRNIYEDAFRLKPHPLHSSNPSFLQNIRSLIVCGDLEPGFFESFPALEEIELIDEYASARFAEYLIADHATWIGTTDPAPLGVFPKLKKITFGPHNPVIKQFQAGEPTGRLKSRAKKLANALLDRHSLGYTLDTLVIRVSFLAVPFSRLQEVMGDNVTWRRQRG